MEASTGCRPENLGLCSIQLEPVGTHLPGYIIDAGRDDVLKLNRCRRTTEPIDLGVICIQMRARDHGPQEAVASQAQQCTRTGSVQGPTPVVRHTESVLETKLTNQFGRIGGGQPDKTGTIDVYQTSSAIRALQALQKNVVVYRVEGCS